MKQRLGVAFWEVRIGDALCQPSLHAASSGGNFGTPLETRL